jgi:rhodanese-related sulfurtransferase
MRWKSIFTEIALLLSAALLAGAAANLLRPEPKKLAWTSSYLARRSPRTLNIESGAAATFASASSPLTKRLLAIAPAKDPGLLFLKISHDVARKLHGAGAMFIDARRSESYEAGHIAGARSIAVWEHGADAKVSALQTEAVPPDQVIVVYCSGERCEDSSRLAEKLALAGFFNVYVYSGGFAEWQFIDGSVRQGKNP